MKNRKRIFEIIQIGEETDLLSRLFDFGVMGAILLNLAIAIASTFEAAAPWMGVLHVLEGFTVVLFTIEYALRIWTADYLFPDKSRVRATLKFIFSPSGLIDFLAFFPFYLPTAFPSGIIAFRIFRVVRILRLFRINKYYDALRVITEVLDRKKTQLFSSIIIIMVLMAAASLMMYSLEHEAQPEVFQNAFSGFWWAASTLLTVGYGDIYPVTLMGKIVGIFITFLGVGMVAIPTGILSAGFVEHVEWVSREKIDEGAQKSLPLSAEGKCQEELHTLLSQNGSGIRYCPFCGKKL